MESSKEQVKNNLIFSAFMIGFMKKNSTDSEKIISFFEKNNWLTN
jgi:hypothetical protein